MNPKREILSKCFKSNSRLWSNYLDSEDDLRILYYPSAGDDLRPFIYSQPSALNYLNIDYKLFNFEVPNLFIFSDYYPYDDSDFFDSNILYKDEKSSLEIQEYCELFPNPEHYRYSFNEEYVAFKQGMVTGKAIFFKIKIQSHLSDSVQYTHAIYFFYENINLLDQLFLKHNLEISHLVWKRDGSGLGGGVLQHSFLYGVAAKLNTKFMFDSYSLADQALVNNQTHANDDFPEEINRHLRNQFELKMEKMGQMIWGYDDLVNLNSITRST